MHSIKYKIGYLNAVLQSLFASRILVAAYLNPKNSKWIDTPFNRRLQEFFKLYRGGIGVFDPLPYVEEALNFKDPEFEPTKDHDPTIAIHKIFTALIFSQAKIIKEAKNLQPESHIEPSETFTGKYFTSKIVTQAVCTKCKKSDWTVHESQIFSVPLNSVNNSLL